MENYRHNYGLPGTVTFTRQEINAIRDALSGCQLAVEELIEKEGNLPEYEEDLQILTDILKKMDPPF